MSNDTIGFYWMQFRTMISEARCLITLCTAFIRISHFSWISVFTSAAEGNFSQPSGSRFGILNPENSFRCKSWEFEPWKEQINQFWWGIVFISSMIVYCITHRSDCTRGSVLSILTKTVFVFVYLYLCICICMSDTREHCLWGPCTQGFSKI